MHMTFSDFRHLAAQTGDSNSPCLQLIQPLLELQKVVTGSQGGGQSEGAISCGDTRVGSVHA